MDDSDESFYSVPPPPRVSDGLRSDPVPELMPKKGNAVRSRESFAALDRKNVVGSPTPAPRVVTSNKSGTIKSTMAESNGGLIHTEEDRVPNAEKARDSIVSKTSEANKAPQATRRKVARTVPGNFANPSAEGLDDTSTQEVRAGNSPAAMRPKPKPRTIKSNVIPKISTPEEHIDGERASLSSFGNADSSPGLTSFTKNNEQILKDPSDNSSTSYGQLPPMADDLEEMFEKELKEKYDLFDKELEECDLPDRQEYQEGHKENLAIEQLATLVSRLEVDEDHSEMGPLEHKVQLKNEDGNLFTKKPQTENKFTLSSEPYNHMDAQNTECSLTGSSSSFIDTIDKNKQVDHDKTSLMGMDLSELDPLNKDKSSVQSTLQDGKSGQGLSCDEDDFLTSDTSDVYFTAFDMSTVKRDVSPKVSPSPGTPSPHNILLMSEVSGCQEPSDLPPPLPAANFESGKPRPPPVPPRPGPLPLTAQEGPMISIKRPADGGDTFSPGSSIFDDLPTPQFPEMSSDPFDESEFDYTCVKFNTIAEKDTARLPPIPPLPSPHTLSVRDSPTQSPQLSPNMKNRALPAIPISSSPVTVPKSPVLPPVPPLPIKSVIMPPRVREASPPVPPASTKPKLAKPIAGAVGLPGMIPVASQKDPGRISKFVVPAPVEAVEYSLAQGKPVETAADDEDTSDSDNSMGGGEMMPQMFPQTEMSAASRYLGSVDMSTVDPNTLPRAELPSPKKNVREGLLSKQGGFSANKGWRKRWVVFDGNKLSYYDSNKSQVSKRVIPVQCIQDVEIDVKPDSYKFKVFTNLKNRVFVFASEKRDDCTMWANVLMAAVVAHKNNNNGPETPLPTKPDKEGLITINNKKEYYVTISGQMLCYFHTFEDYQYGSPVHEIDMKLASVKDNDSKKLKLQLWTHYGHFDLGFTSEQEMQQWRLAMEDAIAEGLSDDTVLTKVYDNLSNQQCADCGADNPHWASINLGVVVCKNCAGVHRMFDYRITRIKSLRMDTRVWSPSLIELMVTIGNANANLFWAGKKPAGENISSTEMMERRKEFITKKYVEKKFADKHPLASLKQALGEELLKAAAEDDLLSTMKILFSGADIMFRKNGDGPTAFELTKEGRQRRVMEFLFQNGGDPQSLMDNQDENRLRDDVRLQGFLFKTGPQGKGFERRWCVLEHGALTYYLNEKANIAKGAVDRKNMLMISSVETDKMGYQFELSTTLKENRTFMFSSDIKDDASEWMRTIAKLMAPVAVMEHVGMIDIKFAAYAHMKELVDEWHQTFLVLCWRGLNYMNKDLKFDYLDLRKATSIKMQDANMGFQNQGPCLVISCTGRSVYLQANLLKDTEKIYHCLQEAITGSGRFLSDQALTSNDVPVIVDRCITHIEKHGLMETGIYRTAGQRSKVEALLEDFRKDALSVSLSDYPVSEVADNLKRFLRQLDDSVFGRINYQNWINAAGIEDNSSRLENFKYYLGQMPRVNFNTLKQIIIHLYQVSQHCDVNKMSIPNLAACFAPTLMRTDKDKTHLQGDTYSKEIKIIVDLLENKELFFQTNEDERITADNIEWARRRIQRVESQRVKTAARPDEGYLVPCQILDRPDSVNIRVTQNGTAAEAITKLDRDKFKDVLGPLVLYEVFFNGGLVRPLFPNDLIADTIQRWTEFNDWVSEDIKMSLSVRGLDMLHKLDDNYKTQTHSLQAELQYSDHKSKKFKLKTVRFQQYQLGIYNKAKDTQPADYWNVEDIKFYIGTWPKRNSPTGHCLTFLVNDRKTKYTKAFGHCLCFSTEEELYSWAAVLYAVQNPCGLLSWNGASSA